MKPVIEVNNLSKEYGFRSAKGIETNLREEIYNFFKFRGKKNDKFLALDDVSFKINQGESIGIIGSNGAGKSTLLKILSGITTPTNGSVTIRGSISSILEVGTGFHPELTGRENIYLNSALHGLSRNEVRSKFDEIVAFSGVEKFIDTPFKHYSSGMQVRLAFSIISHIESDIMITDEVLAVGDAEFQKKSLKKMKEIFNQGRTIIFVSHQQTMVSMLTNRCLLIENGRLTADGPTKDVLKSRFKEEGRFVSLFVNDNERLPAQQARLIQAGITDLEGFEMETEVLVTQPYKVFMEFEVLNDLGVPLTAVFQIKNPEGQLAFTSHSNEMPIESSKKGRARIECIVPGNLLNIGQYYITVSLVTQQPYEKEYFIHHNCLSLGIQTDPEEEQFRFYGNYTGLISPKLDWTYRKIEWQKII